MKDPVWHALHCKEDDDEAWERELERKLQALEDEERAHWEESERQDAKIRADIEGWSSLRPDQPC